jgi:hypothetical protein
MARHIRVPGLVDVVLVTAPEEIRAFDEEPLVDRNFIARGPLANRLITGRIRRWFEIMGQPLPSLARRGDQIRAERQRQLAAALDPGGGRVLWSDAQLDTLATYVRGDSSDEAAAITAQEIVGRLFDSGYSADRASWDAAALIDKFRDGFSPIQIVWQITGRLRRARDLLVTRANETAGRCTARRSECTASSRRWRACGICGRCRIRTRSATTLCCGNVWRRPSRSPEPSRPCLKPPWPTGHCGRARS